MAIEVEDGTGKANAESFISVTDADAHFAARGFSLWATMSTTEKENALRRAMDYMLQVYRKRWAGTRTSDTQALDWPRQDVPIIDSPAGAYYASDAVPDEVIRAHADLAYKAAGGDLNPTLGRRTTREKVDVIEVEFDKNAPQWPVYKSIDDALAPFFKVTTSGVNRQVVRV